jgi:hypothetical protein
VVADTWGAAAGCLCRGRLGERGRTIPYYSYFRKHEEKSSKMTKILLKVQIFTEKLSQN